MYFLIFSAGECCTKQDCSSRFGQDLETGTANLAGLAYLEDKDIWVFSMTEMVLKYYSPKCLNSLNISH